jgi:hypothetical protein
MLRLLPYRCCRLRKGWVGEGTQRYANSVWSPVGAPIHRRAATWTEIEPKLAPFLAVANILCAHPVDPDLSPWEIRADAKRRAGAALTFPTMTGDDERWLAGGIGSQRPAAAMGSSHVAPFDRLEFRRSYDNFRRWQITGVPVLTLQPLIRVATLRWSTSLRPGNRRRMPQGGGN